MPRRKKERNDLQIELTAPRKRMQSLESRLTECESDPNRDDARHAGSEDALLECEGP